MKAVKFRKCVCVKGPGGFGACTCTWWLRWSEVKISVKHTICTRNKRTLPQQNLRSILWCMYNMYIYVSINHKALANDEQNTK